MRVLVTAGPTREYLDAVRYLTNGSSGGMGYALARAARDAGHEVVLVSGPTGLRVPKGVDFVPVICAREMLAAVLDRYADSDVVIMNAAVCDFRPKRQRSRKMKKTETSVALELVPNPDILQTLGRRKERQRLMGFALETHRGMSNAKEKLRRKHLDWIVLNSPSAIGAISVDATLISADGSIERFTKLAKSRLARRLVRIATAPS